MDVIAWSAHLTEERAAEVGARRVEKGALFAAADVLTPHLGYVTRKTYEIFHRDAVEDVAAFLAGSPVRVLTG
jgi:phosphoglycerate dehydrogenase-like enzyme